MELEQLKEKIESIDALVKSGALTKERAQTWKDRVIAEFENTNIPQEQAPRREMPNDLAHLPGRLVGKMIAGLGNMSERMAQNTADRIAQIERDRTGGSGQNAHRSSSRSRTSNHEKANGGITINVNSEGSQRKEDRRSERKKNPFDLPEIYR